MNEKSYKNCLGRLTPETPFKICRICIQETNNLISSTDTEWSEIRSLYEYISKFKVLLFVNSPLNLIISRYVLISLKGYWSNRLSLLRMPRMLQYVARD